MSAPLPYPTPWEWKDEFYAIDAANGENVFKHYDYEGISFDGGDEEREAHVKHIVRCVNAWDDHVALRARLAELNALTKVGQ